MSSIDSDQEIKELVGREPCMICEGLSKKDSSYKIGDTSNIMMIMPVRDGALRRLTGRDQRKIYTLCSKHMRVLTMMFNDYVEGKYKPSRGS
jgi:hypothetical protein